MDYFCSSGRAIAQAVSRQRLTEESMVRSRVNPCAICGGKVALGQVLLRVLRFFSVNISFHRLSQNSYRMGDEQYVR
jgi:hypothetical protein